VLLEKNEAIGVINPSFFAQTSFLKKIIVQRVHRLGTRINYRIVPVSNLNKYFTMLQVGLNNMYIDIDANNGSEKL